MAEQCTAKSKQSGERCKRWARPGLSVCIIHGGGTKKAIAKAERVHAARLAESEAAQAVALFGGRRDIHPAAALLELVQTKAREVEYWRYRVANLDEQDLTWGVTKVKDGGQDGGETQEAKPAIELVMLRQAEQDMASYAEKSLKAGVDQQMIMIAQSQAAQLMGLIRAVLGDPRLGISASAPVDVVLGEKLKEIAA